MLEPLTQLLSDVDGAWATAIGSLDGLLVESQTSTGEDLNILVAEHAGILRAVQSAYTHTLSGGETRELYLRGERLGVYLHPIGTQFFLLIALDARSNLGQARLYGRVAARQLEAHL